MQTDNMPVERRLEAEIVMEIAEEYRQRGYRVLVEPSASQLPKFLRDYRPDIIAEGPSESVVIELKSPGRLVHRDDWAKLAEAIREHPGWRLELVIEPGGGRPLPVTIPRDRIDTRLEEGLRLADAQHLEASLLILWSAAESAMRLVATTNEVDVPDTRPSTVITRLYTNGLTEREEYDLLMHHMRIVDALVHGFQSEAVTADLIQRLYAVVARLLAEEVGSEQGHSEMAI